MYQRYDGLPDVSMEDRPKKNTKGKKPAGGRSGSRKQKGELQSTNIYAGRSAYYEEDYYGDAYPPDDAMTKRTTTTQRRPSLGNSPRSGNSSAKKRKKKRQQRRMIIGTLVFLALVAVACVFLVKSCSEPVPVDPAEDVFRSAVTINGIDISGMTVDQARAAVTPGLDYTFANIAITLQNETFSHRITGEEMGVTADLEALLLTALSGGANQNYYTTLSFDYQMLDNRIAEINASLETGPTDATFKVNISDSGKPEFEYTEGTPGYGLNIESTEQLVKDALESNQLQAVLTPQLTMVEPQVTVEDIKAHTQLRAKFTTTYRAEGYDGLTEEDIQILENRAFNIDKGADLLNGTVLRVGETASFNKIVGDRTEERGWKLANAIIFGNRYNLEAGGGICQVSTTLYGALLRGNIEIVYRRHHSFPSDYVDKGLDATVDTGHIDFKWKNDTNHPLYIFCYITRNRDSNRKRDITVAIYGEALPENVTYKPRTELIEEILPGEPEIVYDKKKTEDYNVVEVEARNGYIIDVYLDKLVDGKVESSELLYQDEYKVINERRRIGTIPLATPTPVPTKEPAQTPVPGTESMP